MLRRVLKHTNADCPDEQCNRWHDTLDKGGHRNQELLYRCSIANRHQGKGINICYILVYIKRPLRLSTQDIVTRPLQPLQGAKHRAADAALVPHAGAAIPHHSLSAAASQPRQRVVMCHP